MANYHLEVNVISRGKGRSVTRLASYISGERLYDAYEGKVYSNYREDVLFFKIYQPSVAPKEFYKLQSLCNKIDEAEKRYDARTAREFIGSLPNELPMDELEKIISDYIEHNFVTNSLCAVAAIHEGKNELEPSKNNPHVHIIVPTRTVSAEGFAKKKHREWDKKEYIKVWREAWAEVQNRAYERNRLDMRVSSESLEVQGKLFEREPTIHLSRIEWEKEKRGERTFNGDRKRDIQIRNEKRIRQRKSKREKRRERSR